MPAVMAYEPLEGRRLFACPPCVSLRLGLSRDTNFKIENIIIRNVVHFT